MARVGRIFGALLAETEGAFYLVGNTKEPCDWSAAGFEAPASIDARERPFMRLAVTGGAAVAPPYLSLELEGEALPKRLADVFVIERTGSVSERIWRLVTGQGDEDDAPAAAVIPARWLGEAPPVIWQIVRDSVLRCS